MIDTVFVFHDAPYKGKVLVRHTSGRIFTYHSSLVAETTRENAKCDFVSYALKGLPDTVSRFIQIDSLSGNHYTPECGSYTAYVRKIF